MPKLETKSYKRSILKNGKKIKYITTSYTSMIYSRGDITADDFVELLEGNDCEYVIETEVWIRGLDLFHDDRLEIEKFSGEDEELYYITLSNKDNFDRLQFF